MEALRYLKVLLTVAILICSPVTVHAELGEADVKREVLLFLKGFEQAITTDGRQVQAYLAEDCLVTHDYEGLPLKKRATTTEKFFTNFKGAGKLTARSTIDEIRYSPFDRAGWVLGKLEVKTDNGVTMLYVLTAQFNISKSGLKPNVFFIDARFPLR